MAKCNSLQILQWTHIRKRCQWIIFQKQIKTFLRIAQRKINTIKSAVGCLRNIQHLRFRTKSEEWKVKSQDWHCNSCHSYCSYYNFIAFSFHGCKYVTHFHCNFKIKLTPANERNGWKLALEKERILLLLKKIVFNAFKYSLNNYICKPWQENTPSAI